jgi:hypothetical protein
MKINRDYVLAHLRKLKEQYGGYFGTDLLNLAYELKVTLFGLKKRLGKWLREDPAFASLQYLGMHKPTLTRNEIKEIQDRRDQKPLEIKKHILDDLNKERNVTGIPGIAKTTFYRAAKQTYVEPFFPWFARKNIKLPSTYSVGEARESLSTVFTFSDLKTYGGADIRAIYDRWMLARKYFSVYEVEPIVFYPELLQRERQLRSLLSSIPPDQQEAIQARLIFEIQAAFLVECLDALLQEIIHRRGRIQQSMKSSRQKVENTLRKNALESVRAAIKETAQSSSPDMQKLYFLSETVPEGIKARMVLLKRHKKSYDLILNMIQNLVKTLGENVMFHTHEGANFYKLAAGETPWKYLDEISKKRLARDSYLTMVIENGNEDIAKYLAIDRLVEYIRHGKITFRSSYRFQNVGLRIEQITIEEDGFLTNDVLKQLMEGTFSVDLQPLYEAGIIDEDLEDSILPEWIDFSIVLKEVSRYVRETTPGWFDEHIALFKKQTDGMFSIEYSEEEFAERLYDAIGFLGRNLRYKDSEKFLNLQYFARRYVTEAALRLELKFINCCIERLSRNTVNAVLIDTIGIEGRKKSFSATLNNRYCTLGMVDLRAVSMAMLPVFSSGYRSTDSEAMNIVEVLKDVQEICNGNVKICSGNGHATSRVAAGMAFLSYGVIAAGRIIHKPTKPLGKRRIVRLMTNISLLNRVGKLLREEPTLGRVMACRKHVYVDGVNVRGLVEDVGYLILHNVCKTELPIRDLIQTMEKSNYLKKKARIVDGGITRAEIHEANILLKSSELVLCIAGLYHLLKGWEGPESPVNLSDIRLFIPA